MEIKQKLLARVDELIKKADEMLRTATVGEWGKFPHPGLFFEFRTASLSLILGIYSNSHPYYVEFYEKLTEAIGRDAEKGKGILLAIRSEIENDWLEGIKGLISAEIFTDFMEMAEHLLKEGYHTPAAVMIGSVLEEHMRHLCIAHTVDITYINGKGETVPKKAESMNGDLSKVNVYNTLQQKIVTGWLGIRNSAAHGKYSEYTPDQVRNMYDGVLNFVGSVK